MAIDEIEYDVFLSYASEDSERSNVCSVVAARDHTPSGNPNEDCIFQPKVAVLSYLGKHSGYAANLEEVVALQPSKVRTPEPFQGSAKYTAYPR